MSPTGRASHAIAKCLCIFFIVLVLVTLSAGQAITGTLSEATTTTTTTGNCTIRESNFNWTFTDNLGAPHTFPTPTNTHIFQTCSSSCNPGGTKSGCFTGCGCPQTGSTSKNEWSSDGLYYLQATAATGKIVSA